MPAPPVGGGGIGRLGRGCTPYQGRRWVAAGDWLRGYGRAALAGDLVAGLITGVLLVPQGIAFALLAGLPPECGLYAGIAPAVVYALLGSSRTLSVGPVSVAALMVATALASPGLPGAGLSGAVLAGQSPAANALILAAESGAIFLSLAALRAGPLMHFISHPVLAGFTNGAALLIMASQLPGLLGTPAGAGACPNWAALPGCLAAQGQALHPATALLGLATVALLLFWRAGLPQVLRRLGAGPGLTDLLPRLGPLVAVLIAPCLLAGLGGASGIASGIATVGTVAAGPPPLSLDFLTLPAAWGPLLPAAVVIALVGYVESIAIARTVAAPRHERICADQELFALGAANLAAACTGAMPVAGSFSRTLVNVHAGARTQAASLIAAAVLLGEIWGLAPAFTYLPKAALAAIVIVAVAPLLTPGEPWRLWRFHRPDAFAFLVTFGGVLGAGIGLGIGLGICATLLGQIWRTSRPHFAIVGRLPGTEHYRNCLRHPEVERWPGLLLVRIDESLSFANSAAVEEFLAVALRQAPATRHLILLCGSISHVDSTALDSLRAFVPALGQAGITLHLSEVKGPVMDALAIAGLPALLAPGRIFFRTDEAVAALAAAPAQTGDDEISRLSP